MEKPAAIIPRPTVNLVCITAFSPRMLPRARRSSAGPARPLTATRARLEEIEIRRDALRIANEGDSDPRAVVEKERAGWPLDRQVFSSGTVRTTLPPAPSARPAAARTTNVGPRQGTR
jgi:hypothetical protein